MRPRRHPLLAAFFLGSLLVACARTSERRSGVGEPPPEAARLADLVARRDAVVTELLTELSVEDPRSPAMGNRFRGLSLLGRLRSRDEAVVRTLVEQMLAIGVPKGLVGSERDREMYFPAVASLRTLRGGTTDEVLLAGMRASDPLRHRLTAWLLRHQALLPEAALPAFVSEVDRALESRYHRNALAIEEFLRDPPIESDPPAEIGTVWKSPEFRERGREAPAAWVARAEGLARELREADALVVALVEGAENRHTGGSAREWALWLGGRVASSEEVVSSRAPDRWLAWLPRGAKSLACAVHDPEWERFFPYAVFASRVGSGWGTERILRTVDRDDSPLLVDLATWVVVQALGREVGAAALRAWARSELRDTEAASRLQSAAVRAAEWEARSVPPSDVLRELKMGSWTFRRNCD